MQSISELKLALIFDVVNLYLPTVDYVSLDVPRLVILRRSHLKAAAQIRSRPFEARIASKISLEDYLAGVRRLTLTREARATVHTDVVSEIDTHLAPHSAAFDSKITRYDTRLRAVGLVLPGHLVGLMYAEPKVRIVKRCSRKFMAEIDDLGDVDSLMQKHFSAGGTLFQLPARSFGDLAAIHDYCTRIVSDEPRKNAWIVSSAEVKHFEAWKRFFKHVTYERICELRAPANVIEAMQILLKDRGISA